MNAFLQRESNKITIAVFYEGYQLEKYNLDPAYQRLSVWTEEKRSFLIDSILKNYPIPPVFLHQKINEDTGATMYDVIDGKQRLLSIIQFIENDISVSTEDAVYSRNDDEEEGDVNPIAGKKFDELHGPLSEYKSRFWRYVIPIEYVDTSDQAIIDSIFDRLNRNGEPLRGQELRNANYYDSPLLSLVEGLADIDFWKRRLIKVDRARMEDLEFLSELIFLLNENKELTANQSVLDELYEKYRNIDSDHVSSIRGKFTSVTDYMESLNIDFEGLKINGVSHLYGIFSFCLRCLEAGIDVQIVSGRVFLFYDMLRRSDFSCKEIRDYKDSMSSNTKSGGQRKKRTDALLSFCSQPC